MGVQISKILPKKQIEMEDLTGRKIAVDAFLWLHQFLSIIRQRDGTPLKDSKGRITSHLSGLFYRSPKLLENNIKLVWVFDGERPELKYDTIKERNQIKEEAEKKWKEALELGDMVAARKAAQMTSRLTSEMIEQAKELLLSEAHLAVAFGAGEDGVEQLPLLFEDAVDPLLDRVEHEEPRDGDRPGDPAAVLRGIYQALKPDGTFLMQDIDTSSHLHKNREHPVGTFFYTISCMHCMTVSLAQGGVGLGTCWGVELAQDMLREAGFACVDLHRLPHDVFNCFFVVRK